MTGIESIGGNPMTSTLAGDVSIECGFGSDCVTITDAGIISVILECLGKPPYKPGGHLARMCVFM